MRVTGTHITFTYVCRTFRLQRCMGMSEGPTFLVYYYTGYIFAVEMVKYENIATHKPNFSRRLLWIE